ncbi:hypothetical protein [Alteromonas sp. a30]|uniref:hypothetical protein n=1 Tax=Alteromonas sp. a30 TaxID=2730917 RepID=UPI00227FD5DA|nr:hypothetical protein [Alteromonas sp. a30]MCY7297382.1 hypothetical protein [Alteromonas sp. a30]
MKNLIYGAVITVIGAGFYFSFFNLRMDLFLSLALSLVLLITNMLSTYYHQRLTRDYKQQIRKLSAQHKASEQQVEREKQRRARALLRRR